MTDNPKGKGGARPGAGRPRFPNGSGASVALATKVSRQTCAELEQMAEEQGITISALVRYMIIEQLEKESG